MTERSHRPPILKPDESYTFGSYFLMKFAPANILRELGATLTSAAIELPVASSVQLTRLPDLRQRIEDGNTHLPYTYTTSVEGVDSWTDRTLPV